MKTFGWTFPEPKHPKRGERHTYETSNVWNRLSHPLWLASAAVFILAFVLLTVQSDGSSGVFIFLPFTFGPMIVSLVLGTIAASRRSLLVLLVANLLYFCWFLLVYISAFYLWVDPQAGIAFIFIGFYSLPVMIPLWIVAMYFLQSKDSESEQAVSGNRR